MICASCQSAGYEEDLRSKMYMFVVEGWANRGGDLLARQKTPRLEQDA